MGSSGMGSAEWIAVASICLTIVLSIIGLAFWAGKQQAGVLLELAKLRNELRDEMKYVETKWVDKLALTVTSLQHQISEGPVWLQNIISRQDEAISVLSETARVALKASERQGAELQDVKHRLETIDAKLQLIIKSRVEDHKRT